MGEGGGLGASERILPMDSVIRISPACERVSSTFLMLLLLLLAAWR